MAASGVTLYYNPKSFYSQKGRLALEEKGVPYKSHVVNMEQDENLSPGYMKLNPQGKVPLLQHGDKYIADSKVITEYVDKHFDGPPLFPKANIAEASKMLELIESLNVQVLTYGSFDNEDLTKDRKMPPQMVKMMREKVLSKKGLETLKKHLSECKDDPGLEAAYKTKIASYTYSEFPPREAVLATLDHASKVLDACEKKLAENAKDPSMKEAWLVDRTFTAVDIALAVLLFRIRGVGFGHRFFPSRPNLSNYMQSLTKRASVIQVCIEQKVE